MIKFINQIYCNCTLSSFFGFVFLFIFYSASGDDLNIVHCASDSIHSIEGVVELTTQKVDLEKGKWSYFSYKNIGIAVVSLTVVALLIYSKSPGGDSGTALDFKAVHWGSDTSSDAAGEALTAAATEILPVVAASAAALAVPGVVDAVMHTGSTVAAISVSSQELLTAGMIQHSSVPSALLPFLEWDSVNYFSNYIEMLRDPIVRTAVIHLANTEVMCDFLFDLLNASSGQVTRLLSELSHGNHGTLLTLGYMAVFEFFESLSLPADTGTVISSALTLLAFKCMSDPIIVAALRIENSYDVVASVFIDFCGWDYVDDVMNSLGGSEGLDSFFNFLIERHMTGLDDFQVRSFDDFKVLLQKRGSAGVPIQVDESFVTVKALSLIFKSFMLENIPSFLR